MKTSPISRFINKHFRHFNAITLREAAESYKSHLKKSGKMLVTISGAMSTAEIGLSLAKMIQTGKVHAISCTGANLEEDIFNLVAHNFYKKVKNYRCLSAQEEQKLFKGNLNRVTDVCIPDKIIWNRLEFVFKNQWELAVKARERYFPHEFFYKILHSRQLERHYQIDPKSSWVYAAMERNLPIFVPGWEDSSLGNMFACTCVCGKMNNSNIVRCGTECMIELAKWYTDVSARSPMGIFQIGGGIAGSFAKSVVSTLHRNLSTMTIEKWKYYCQISDSTTSYGSYSGAIPTEKTTQATIHSEAPYYIIESDATIVAPLIFAYISNW